MAAVQPTRGSHASGAHILIVDDESDTLQRLLTEAGYKVHTVDDGAAALAACRRNPPDLLISAIALSRCDGLELLKAVRADKVLATIPVILANGTADQRLCVEALAAGADDCLCTARADPEAMLLARIEGALRTESLRHIHAAQLHRLHRKLRLEIRLSHDLQQVGQLGCWQMDLRRQTVRFSQECAQVLGGGAAAFDGHYETILARIHPEDRKSVDQGFQRAIATRDSVELKCRALRLDGALRHIQLRMRLYRSRAGQPLRMLGTVQDITEFRQLEDASRVASTAFDHTDDAIVVTDNAGRVTAVNPAFPRMTGYSRNEVIGGSALAWGASGQSHESRTQMWLALVNSGHWQGEVWNRRKNGEEFPVLQNTSPVRDEEGRVTHYVSILTDISKLKAAQEQLAHLAHHDALTGLGNRLKFSANLDQTLDRASRHNTHVALCLLDLDKFKDINDNLGHPAGDALLREVAARMKSCVRAEDSLARLGGDEFAVLVVDLARPEDVEPVARKLVEAVALPFSFQDHPIEISTSIGVGLYPDHARDSGGLIQASDSALYRAKNQGRNRYVFYSAQGSGSSESQGTQESDLQRALANGELVLRYQPEIDAASGLTTGVEALLRWRHPERDLLLPRDFLPAAERSGLIEEIGDWVLQTAVSAWRAWQGQQLSPPGMSINVAIRQIRNERLAEALGLALAGDSEISLELELSEKALYTDERCIRSLRQLRDSGVRIAIDNFGSGPASLSALIQLPVDTVKIDPVVVHDQSAGAHVLTTAIIQMAHGIGLRVVAECVENAEQRDFLRGAGCDMLQGNLLAPPMSADAIAERLRREVAMR